MSSLRSLALFAGAALAVVACGEAAPSTAPAVPEIPEAPATTSAVPALSPSLRDAVADARIRLAPSVDDAMRAPVRDALAALDAALVAGDAGRARREIASARALLAAHGDAADGDAADLAAIRMLLDLAVAPLSEAR